MTSSHPPTLLTLVARAFRSDALVRRGATVLVAVSGGPDSMALLHALSRVQKSTALHFVAHGVDHGLREAASHELDLAERYATHLGVPFGRTHVVVSRGGNLQARARDARYDALHAAAHRAGADALATGHHADDRAETVLLRLLRGAGPRGLAALPPVAPPSAEARAGRRVALIRPMLRARRRDIDAHIARHRVPFATDPSNVDERYARTRVRHELLPLLEELSPAIVEHLCALSDQLHESLADSPVISLMERVDGAPYYPPPLSRPTQLALTALVHFPRKNASVELPRGLVATFDRGKHKIVVAEWFGVPAANTAPWPSWKHREGNGRHHNEG